MRSTTIVLPSRIIETLVEKLKLNPHEETEMRLELAEEYLKESREYTERRDAVQASERLYKAVEECIKMLSQLHRLPEYEKAKLEGRWWTQLLGKAARKLAETLREPRIADTWARAYDIHVWGFHEAKYAIKDIRGDIEYAKWLIDYTRRQVERPPQTAPQTP